MFTNIMRHEHCVQWAVGFSILSVVQRGGGWESLEVDAGPRAFCGKWQPRENAAIRSSVFSNLLRLNHFPAHPAWKYWNTITSKDQLHSFQVNISTISRYELSKCGRGVTVAGKCVRVSIQSDSWCDTCHLLNHIEAQWG